MTGARRRWPGFVVAGALTLAAVVGWSVWVVASVSGLRVQVERNVGTLAALGRLRARLDTPDPALAADAAAALARAGHDAPSSRGDGEVVLAALARGDAAAASAAVDRVTTAVRARNRALSIELGTRWRHLYGVAAVVIALAGGLLVVAVISHRRRLRAEAGEAELAARDGLLRDAARRWVSGDLAAPVTARGPALDEFEQALDDVRRALAARLDEVEAQRAALARLNDDLRLQIRHKSEELAQAMARAPRRAALVPGATIAGQFEIVRALGEGAMGAVYAVRRLGDGRPLALKLLRDDGNAVHRARFVREARMLAEIDHANVLRILDVDVTDSGALFLVTELIDGQNLADDDHARELDVLAVLRGIAAGLAAIHAQGVVHRDLKLANIVVGAARDGAPPTVKIVDFGIARDASAVPLDAAAEELTAQGVMVGTLRYMAPECRDDVPPAPPCDVFAFGVVAFRLALGRFPWSTAPLLVLKSFGHLPPPRVPERDPAPPPALVELILRCLDEAPAARPTADEVAATLARL